KVRSRAMFSGMTVLVALAAAFAAGIAVALYFERSRTAVERVGFERQSRSLAADLEEARARLEAVSSKGAAQEAAIARLEERNAAAERVVEQMRIALPETFKSLAGEVLEEKSRRFAEHNQASLGQVLEPFKTRLEDFQSRIEAARLEQVRSGANL